MRVLLFVAIVSLTLLSCSESSFSSKGKGSGSSRNQNPNQNQGQNSQGQQTNQNSQIPLPNPNQAGLDQGGVQIGDGCRARKDGFVGLVYQLNSSTRNLPDFQTMTPVGQIRATNLDVTERDWKTNFPVKEGSAITFNEWFGIDFFAYLNVTQAGDYDFWINSDDGAKVYIDGNLIIDNDGVHWPQERDVQRVALTQGEKLLRVSWFQGPRYKIALDLKWRRSGDSQYAHISPSLLKSSGKCGLQDLGTFNN